VKPKGSYFYLVFAVLGGSLVVFVLLPLVSTLAGTSASSLIQALVNPQVLRSIMLTFNASALATGIALLSGIPLAFLLARRSFRGKRLLEAVIDLPVIVPHTAAGIALLMVFGSQGVLGKWLAPLGLYFTDSLAGIVVAMLFVSLPYLINMSRESFALLDRELESIALVEGATHWQSFFYVSLPLAWRGVVAGAMMMWARGISEFGAVVILAYNPKIVPVLIYELFQGYGLSTALPVAALLIIIVLIVFSVLRWLVISEDRGN
jgi:molybdate/tungstate transport system permease protein